jgi:flagellar protein FliS
LDSNVSKYIAQQVMTATPAKLVYLLYEKAISSLHEACKAIDTGAVETRWRANNRAIEIISHLWSTLDMERGGEISQQLAELFPYMITRLAEVDVRNDPVPAEEVIGLLEPLRDAWRDLARTNPGAEAAAPPAQGGTTKPAQPVGAPVQRTSISA